jgi:hypothetical protein
MRLCSQGACSQDRCRRIRRWRARTHTTDVHYPIGAAGAWIGLGRSRVTLPHLGQPPKALSAWADWVIHSWIRDTITRTRARTPGVGEVFHRMAVHYRVLRPDTERTIVATTRCTKGGRKLDGGRRMPGAGLSRRSPRKAPLGKPAFQPYWGKPAVRNDRGIEETSASFEARTAPRSYPTKEDHRSAEVLYIFRIDNLLPLLGCWITSRKWTPECASRSLGEGIGVGSNWSGRKRSDPTDGRHQHQRARFGPFHERRINN